MGGGNSSEENAKNIIKINEANDKLSSYKKKTPDLATLALRHLDKRIVHTNNSMVGDTYDTYPLCVNLRAGEPTRIDCDTGANIESIKNFPNIDCKNGEHMYVLDNHRIPLVSKKLNMYNINDHYDGLANSGVYHAIRCDYDNGSVNSLLDKASEILSGSNFSYDNNVLQGSIDALGLDTAKLTEHKYKYDKPTAFWDIGYKIANDDELRLKEEGFKNKRKQQNPFNGLNTFHYQ
jgi:hypothetical protein